MRAAAIVLIAIVLRGTLWNAHDSVATFLPEGDYAVARVIDGDTLELEGGARVRLIGVDTPETVHPNKPPEPWGQQATEFTRQFVSTGTVRLRFDKEPLDRYGRYLAYVYVDDTLLNEALLAAGLARARTAYRYDETMKRRFRAAEKLAHQEHRGIWNHNVRNRFRPGVPRKMQVN